MISRRAFLGGSVTLFAAPLVAEAQQAAKVYRIGVILTSAPNESGHLIKALEEGMRELGYVDERNIVFERRFWGGRQEKPPLLAAGAVRVESRGLLAGLTSR